MVKVSLDVLFSAEKSRCDVRQSHAVRRFVYQKLAVLQAEYACVLCSEKKLFGQRYAAADFRVSSCMFCKKYCLHFVSAAFDLAIRSF